MRASAPVNRTTLAVAAVLSLVALFALLAESGALTITAIAINTRSGTGMTVREIETDMVYDIEDALDILGAATAKSREGSWDRLTRRAEQLGWITDMDGWLKGRRFHVLYAQVDGAMVIAEMYLPNGLLTCSLREPAISVCGGPLIIPFPDSEELLDEFDTFRGESGCSEFDRPYVAAAHRVLCSWFGMNRA